MLLRIENQHCNIISQKIKTFIIQRKESSIKRNKRRSKTSQRGLQS